MKLRPRHWLTTTAFPLVSLIACGDEQDETFSGGEVEIRFSGQVGDEAFACGQLYDDLGRHGAQAAGQDLRFYISNVRLLTEDGAEVPLVLDQRDPWQTQEVALLDFEDGTGPCETSGNSATNNRITGSVPPGNYVGIVFSTSVPEELNHEDPATAAAPLQVTAMQWSWLLGYKFLRAEVKPMLHEVPGNGGEGAGGGTHTPALGGASASGGMGGEPGTGASGAGTEYPGHTIDSQFHLGSLACTNDGSDSAGPPAQSCNKPNRNELRFAQFHPGTQLIVADLKAMMAELDLSQANHCHGMPSASCGEFYASIGLDYETGDQVPGQTAFRVENR